MCQDLLQTVGLNVPRDAHDSLIYEPPRDTDNFTSPVCSVCFKLVAIVAGTSVCTGSGAGKRRVLVSLAERSAQGVRGAYDERCETRVRGWL